MIHSVGYHLHLIRLNSPLNGSLGRGLTDGYDGVKVVQPGEYLPLKKDIGKNDVQPMQGYTADNTRKIVTARTKSGGQAVVKMQDRNTGMLLELLPYSGFEHPEKLDLAFQAIPAQQVDDGVLFHPLCQFETLLFHSADRWRVFVGNEKYFHLRVLKATGGHETR